MTNYTTWLIVLVVLLSFETSNKINQLDGSIPAVNDSGTVFNFRKS